MRLILQYSTVHEIEVRHELLPRRIPTDTNSRIAASTNFRADHLQIKSEIFSAMNK